MIQTMVIATKVFYTSLQKYPWYCDIISYYILPWKLNKLMLLYTVQTLENGSVVNTYKNADLGLRPKCIYWFVVV